MFSFYFFNISDLFITFSIFLVSWLKLILNASTPISIIFFNSVSLYIDGPNVAIILAFFPFLNMYVITLYMKNKNMNLYANKLVNAFLKNQIIAPLPSRFVKKLNKAELFRKFCESKIKKPIMGFKATGTAIPVLKKLGEKEPFYATVYKHNVLKNNKSVRINKYTMGIELEVCYMINKAFFALKDKIRKNDLKKYITHIAPCIEISGL